MYKYIIDIDSGKRWNNNINVLTNREDIMNKTRYETIKENHIKQLSKHKLMCEIPLLPWKLVILKQKEIYEVGVKIGSLIQ